MVCTAEFLGKLLRMDISKTGWRIASLLVAFIALGLLQWVPFVGALANLIILLVGLGSATILLYRKYRGLGNH